MGSSETVEVTGHLMDSGILSRILDDIRDYGGDYVIDQFDVGHEANDPSSARITVEAEDEDSLQRLLMRLQTRGVNQIDPGEAVVGVAERDGVLPDGFYSTTNLETRIRIEGAWYDVENPEMDCGLVVIDGPGGRRVRTVPMSDVEAGMHVVIGAAGIQVSVPEPESGPDAYGQLVGESPYDKPQAVLVRQVADEMRRTRAEGRRLLWVAGPGVVHTGAVPALVALIGAGFVDTLFAGNALATHDIESSLYGASLGVDLSITQGVEHGHEHHVRALNTVRKAGSIAQAVADGVVTSGIMHALVTHRKHYVLVGSVRDDGPLPDVFTDVIEGQRAMRAAIPDVGYCLMMATQLHSVATGNILPATVPLVCVDINPSTVTKLADRGSNRGRGIVTDVGLFLEQLALELVPDYRRA
ncbi:lysine-ketoglutarate reductase/saccharopine dehydrogenase-like protein (TIGR00300 family) [Nocardioides sp. BE266]|uniref:ornithine cyclodeaminase n=1 Tax=Nocardioides sp. BE266 TaxID=2817725 RepID=UPI0028616AA0|nr:TIGR00300 family protein [Nocardioides sp. BE266]MDR7253807.1 lysine-ketoglutarate reductase/saccharopine dehydrogenase-like protein (TIGR00300 family) [Nocardioides sp. BE266]